MTAPRFTVLMPTHYRPDVIGYAIRSVLAQSDGDFELLVVGDGAVEGTAAVVTAFDDPRIRWFDLPKAPGFGYANRNIAMEQSRGALIAFAADDDLMLPDHLARLGAAFDDAAIQWAYSQVLWVSTDGIVAPDLTNLSLDDERQTFLRRRNTVAGGALMFRASAFASRRCWPEQEMKAGDWAMMKALLSAHGHRALRHLPTPTLMHFAAATKRHRHSTFDLLGAWLRVADAVSWWPEALRIPADDGVLQAEVWRRFETDPAFPQRLRDGAADIANRLVIERLTGRVPPTAGDLLDWLRWPARLGRRHLAGIARRFLKRPR